MSKLIIHADDYAISSHVAESVAALIEKGAVDSVSLMPNMKATEKGIALLKPFLNRVLVSVHLNLVEGRCVADPAKIPLLVDVKGYFKLSWLWIMLKSVSAEFRRQVFLEFEAQICKVEPLLRASGYTGKLRLDSHQHIHMIPGIFRTVCGLCRDFDVEYIRLTREPLLPYLRAMGLWRTYRPANIVKNILLNLFSVSDVRMLKRIKLEYNYFLGLLITGKMDYKRVRTLLSLMPGERDLELVLHGGRMLETEITKEYNKKDFIKEHTSVRRLLELETAERLHQTFTERLL